MTRLSDRHRRFAEEYVRSLDRIESYKAIYPGVSDDTARVNSTKLLAKSSVAAYVAELQQQATERNAISADRVLGQLAAIAFADITNVVSFDDSGVVLKDSESLPSHIQAAIESVTIVDSPKTGIRKTVKMHSKVAALEKLMQYLGLSSDLNVAIATFGKYGFEVTQLDDGWRIRKATSE